MFNYPVKIHISAVNDKIAHGFIFSDKKLKLINISLVRTEDFDEDSYALYTPPSESTWRDILAKHGHMVGSEITLPTDKRTNIYHVEFSAGYSDTIEGCKLWAERRISLENFKPDLDWLDLPEDHLLSNLIKYVRKYFTPMQMEVMTDEILARPEESWIEYITMMMVNGGVRGLFGHIADLDLLKRRTRETLIGVRYENEAEVGTHEEIINRYHFDGFHEHAYSAKSLIEPFLILTDGFNQDFLHNGEYYSSVAVLPGSDEEGVNKYCVYVYGSDDSSYTKYFNTIEEAIREAKNLTILGRIITQKHLTKIGFVFTN